MRFLFLVHGDPEADAALTADERREVVEAHMRYAKMLRDRGAHAAGEALEDPSRWSVVLPGPNPIVTDGPFAATKEAVGGFYLVDCGTRQEALELAGKVPVSPKVAVEVIPVVEF